GAALVTRRFDLPAARLLEHGGQLRPPRAHEPRLLPSGAHLPQPGGEQILQLPCDGALPLRRGAEPRWRPDGDLPPHAPWSPAGRGDALPSRSSTARSARRRDATAAGAASPCAAKAASAGKERDEALASTQALPSALDFHPAVQTCASWFRRRQPSCVHAKSSAVQSPARGA